MERKTHVNKEKGTVTTVLSCSQLLPDVISCLRAKEYDKLIMATTMDYKEQEDIFTEKEFRGVARCAKGDTFDEGIGVTISEMKAHIKLNRYIQKKLARLGRHFIDLGHILLDEAMGYKYGVEMMENELNEILKNL